MKPPSVCTPSARLGVTLLVLLLSACSSVPEGAFKMADGCAVDAFNKEFVRTQVANMTWSGACKSGLAHGDGKLLVTRRDGRTHVYVGRMEAGRQHGQGEYVDADGWKTRGDFIFGWLTQGQVFRPNGTLLFDGLMAHNEKDPAGNPIVYSQARYNTGTLYFSDGSRIEDGRFDMTAGLYAGIGSIDPLTGKGLIWGKYVRNNTVVYRMVDGQLFDDEIKYQYGKIARMNRDIEQLNRETAAFNAAQREKTDRENRAALALLTKTAVAVATKTPLPPATLDTEPATTGSSTLGVRSGWQCKYGTCLRSMTETAGYADITTACPIFLFTLGTTEAPFRGTPDRALIDKGIERSAGQIDYNRRSNFPTANYERAVALYRCVASNGYYLTKETSHIRDADMASLQALGSRRAKGSAAFALAKSSNRLWTLGPDYVGDYGSKYYPAAFRDAYARAGSQDGVMEAMATLDIRKLSATSTNEPGAVCNREGSPVLWQQAGRYFPKSWLDETLKQLIEAKEEAPRLAAQNGYRSQQDLGQYLAQVTAAIEHGNCLKRYGWPYAAENTVLVVWQSGGPAR